MAWLTSSTCWLICAGAAASPPNMEQSAGVRQVDPSAADPTTTTTNSADQSQLTASPPATVTTDGFWPTPKMLDGLLARWADDDAVKYQLDAATTDRHRQQLVQRWTRFARENRAVIQPLLNEYIESRLDMAPPDPTAVQDWASRATPMFESFREEFMRSHDELSAILPPVQRAKLAMDGVKIGAAMELFRARLRAWGDGRFDEHEWWDPPRGVRSERGDAPTRESDRRDDNPDRRTAKEKINEELLRWDYHVAQFIESFNLDEAQRQTAYSILRECRAAASAHLDRYRARMELLERGVARHGGTMDDEQRAEATAVYGPVDAIFVEMTRRLEQIPTTAQREAAAAAQPQSAIEGGSVGGPNATAAGASSEPSAPK